MAKKKSNTNGSTSGSDVDDAQVEYVSISQETRRRYLNYAMSVITARALPDVRDGLKPVQRRILYVMGNELRLSHDGKTRKCAKICGDTTGNYHPHGDQAVYEALVRLGQDFSLREPLVIPQGNFGSVIGLKSAAARYTEAKLSAIAAELMSELRSETVETRPNYDGTRQEPVVFPARFPNLLVNGASGIAVGMATNIPPHNLKEVIKASIHLIDNPQATVAQLMKYIKGPDFPLGGRIVTDRRDLTKTYSEGRGPIKVRGEWAFDKKGKKELNNRLIIESIPFEVRSAPLVSEIGNIIAGRKLPQLLEVIDETDEKHGLRIALEIKSGTDPEVVMSYLYKHTALEKNYNLDMTCLAPSEDGVLIPSRMPLNEVLQHFLDFRFATVRRRLEYQLRQLEARIHILEGLAIVFDGLDRALQLIRESEGKRDAADKLMAEFPLDETQTMAILELQLYRISSLEIGRIVEELEEKRAEADRIGKLLRSDKKLWKLVESELNEIGEEFGNRRRTAIGSSEEISEFDPQAYIVRENTNVVITREGWIKRVGRITSVETTRTREGDTVLEVAPASTTDQIVFFSSSGVAYTLPVTQVPPSTGYGEPLSKHVKMADGARIISAMTTDPRFTDDDFEIKGETAPGPLFVVVTRDGQVMRTPLSPLRTPSTRNGRKYCRLRKEDEVVFCEPVGDAETMFIATKDARIIHFPITDAPVLANPGLGVRGIKLEGNDAVLGAQLLTRPGDCLRVVNTNGKSLSFGQMKYNVTSRGGKGVKTSVRNGFDEIIQPEIELVDWSSFDS